ncbi:putative licABCH operon regulator [compost metagenome]
MVNNLSEVLTLDKDFKKRLIERENKSPTAFDNYVGLPHAVNYGSDKFSISMGILEEPIVWGKNEVRLIIMLIVPDENNIDPDMVISVYEEILKICQNKKFIEELCKVRSYKEFLDLNRKERF